MKRAALALAVIVAATSLVGCDMSKQGEQAANMSYRVYNNSEGPVYVHDLNNNSGNQTAYDECAIGVLATGATTIITLASNPDVFAVEVAAWFMVGWTGGETIENCTRAWDDTVQYDAFSRWVAACSYAMGYYFTDGGDPMTSIGWCVYQGWAVTAIDYTLSIVDSVAETLTACRTLIPLGAYINGQWTIIRFCADG